MANEQNDLANKQINLDVFFQECANELILKNFDNFWDNTLEQLLCNIKHDTFILAYQNFCKEISILNEKSKRDEDKSIIFYEQYLSDLEQKLNSYNGFYQYLNTPLKNLLEHHEYFIKFSLLNSSIQPDLNKNTTWLCSILERKIFPYLLKIYRCKTGKAEYFIRSFQMFLLKFEGEIDINGKIYSYGLITNFKIYFALTRLFNLALTPKNENLEQKQLRERKQREVLSDIIGKHRILNQVTIAIFEAYFYNKLYPILKSKYQLSLEKDILEQITNLDNKTESINSKSEILWAGSNRTEFVQLVYALYEAKLLTNQSNQIIKLVEDLALKFNFDLGENWQSDFSKSIHKRNNDYFPQIFDNLKNAFKIYSERRFNEKNEKS